MKNKINPFYLTAIAIFLIIISPQLLSDGMFMDGLIYAILSKNIANGVGDFWNLHLTETLYPVFNEHPPLAFGLQSLFFMIFGNSILIERFYSFLTFVITGILIIQIWKSIVKENLTNIPWLPIVFWISIPLVSWAASNNMLENTMMIFTSLSVLLILKSYQKWRFGYLFLAGISVFCAFLTKGFVGLFTLSFIFWIFVFEREIGFKRFFIDTAIVVIAAIIPVFVLYLFVPEGIDSILAYIDKQVVGSINNAQTVDSRFFILKSLLLELIPIAALILLAFFVTRKVKNTNPYLKWVFIFLCLGLSGVLPIMISLKQRGFYILASFPFFSIALGLFVLPRVRYLINKINLNSLKYRVFKYFSIFIFAFGVFMVFFNVNKIGRDEQKISDVYIIAETVPHKSIILLDPSLQSDWALHGYFARYFDISLNPNIQDSCEFLLVSKQSQFNVPLNYQLLTVKLNLYSLYKKECLPL